MKVNRSFSRACLALAVAQSLSVDNVTYAATITVNSTSDGLIPDSACNLREAVKSANDDSNYHEDDCVSGFGADVITFGSGANGQTITLTDGRLILETEISVVGPGSNNLAISGNNADAVFLVTDPVEINGLTVRDAQNCIGAGIIVTGTGTSLTLDDVTLTDNSACRGGGIHGAPSLSEISIFNSTITGNTASDKGGGGYFANSYTLVQNTMISDNIADEGGGLAAKLDTTHLRIGNSTISNNTADYLGGGIYAFDAASVSVINSTVSGNSAGDNGGGVHGHGIDVSLQIENSTIAINSASTIGGGVYVDEEVNLLISNTTISGNDAGTRGGGLVTGPGVTATVQNSTISGNTADLGSGVALGGTPEFNLTNSTIATNISYDPYGAGFRINSSTATITNSLLANQFVTAIDCKLLSGQVFDNGGNFVEGDYATLPCGVFDIEGQDPQLGPLSNNGGPTLTHALLTNSPAIDAGTNTDCGTGKSISADQRGQTRADGKCDIGAFEFIKESCFVVRSTGGGTVVFCL